MARGQVAECRPWEWLLSAARMLAAMAYLTVGLTAAHAWTSTSSWRPER